MRMLENVTYMPILFPDCVRVEAFDKSCRKLARTSFQSIKVATNSPYSILPLWSTSMRDMRVATSALLIT